MGTTNSRYEINNSGQLVEGLPRLLDDKTLRGIVEELFNRNGWKYELLSEKLSSGAEIALKNSNLQRKYVFHLFYGKVRKEEEKRSPKEKRIQLGNKDPRTHIDNSIILGFYVYEEPYTIDNVIIVAWPVDSKANYPTNPSLRVNVEKDILPAKNIGFYRDTTSGKNLVVFRPEFIYYYLENYKELHDNKINQEDNDSSYHSEYKNQMGRNRIVFGAPGTGKSNKLKEDSKELLKDGGSLERVTFYPDYSYSQFVGTYKPVTDENGGISYEFVPGPFMRVYVNAIKNPDKPYLLLIEEINRAKVASVFGDVFQLLDRDEDGLSEYEIQTSEDVKKHLMKELGDCSTKWDHMKIPSNMFIWATMNSADQGVFPMDTAFKRRWNFDYLGINENEDKLHCKLITVGRGDFAKDINWNQLRRAINEKLSKDYKLNEDKLMGPFFLAKSVVENDNSEEFVKSFKNKVIMYLYDDAAKQHKSKLFSGCDDMRYSSVCEAFDEKGIGIFGADFIDLYNQQEG